MVCNKAWSLISFIKCKLINYYSASHILMEKEVSVSAPPSPRFWFFLKQAEAVFHLVSFIGVLFIYIIDKAAPDCSNNRCVAPLLRLTLPHTATKILCDEAVVNTSSSLCSKGVKQEKSAGTRRGAGFKRKAVFAVRAPYFPGEMDGKVVSERRFHSKEI